MAKAGRKSKPGKRDKGGRLIRSAREVTPLDRGSDWVRDRVERFGPHYSSAIGRAYAAGLLNLPSDDNRAAERLQNALRFARLHRRVFGGDFYRCALDDSPRGGMDVVAEITEADKASREWLRVNCTRIEHTAARPFLDQLLWTQHADAGPTWLDRILDAGPRQRDERDMAILALAIRAIDAIGAVNAERIEPEPDAPRIRVA